jgi:hypothetical protein
MPGNAGFGEFTASDMPQLWRRDAEQGKGFSPFRGIARPERRA